MIWNQPHDHVIKYYHCTPQGLDHCKLRPIQLSLCSATGTATAKMEKVDAVGVHPDANGTA